MNCKLSIHPSFPSKESLSDHELHFTWYLKGFWLKEDLEDFIHLMLMIHPNFFIPGSPMPSVFQIYFQGGSMEITPLDRWYIERKVSNPFYEIKTNVASIEVQKEILWDLDKIWEVYLSIWNKNKKKYKLKVGTLNSVKSDVAWQVNKTL